LLKESGWALSSPDRQERGWSVSARWWYIIAIALGGVPLLVLLASVLWGMGGGSGGFSLPDPEPMPRVAAKQAMATMSETPTASAALESSWDAPERLVSAVEFLVAQDDRKEALRLAGRLEPGTEAYEAALLRLNREFVDAWHAAVAEALRECLAQSGELTAETRGELASCLGACAPGRGQLATVPAVAGAARAILLASRAEAEFVAAAPDCPASYRDVLANRLLAAFPGAADLLGEPVTTVAWQDPKQGLTLHVRAHVLLPALGDRLGELRQEARKSMAVEVWGALMVSDAKTWRAYLESADTLPDRRAILALLPPVVRLSWQRDIARVLLSHPGVRDVLASEELLPVVWPGERTAEERLALAQLILRSDAWQKAMRALDYPQAEAAAGRGAKALFGPSEGDVVDMLRKSVVAERELLSAQSFPWYRVMRTLGVQDTPQFWQGHASVTPGQLAHLQGGKKQIADVDPEGVYACMVQHASRLIKPEERKSSLDAARLYALNRGVSVRTNPTR
jgi:hypothetical protein